MSNQVEDVPSTISDAMMEARRPTSGKDRSKVKAARKQRNKK